MFRNAVRKSYKHHWYFIDYKNAKPNFFCIESHMGSTASHMYLVITTAIWMNKSTDQSTNARNVPFGVFGVMLPYKTVRSTHFSDLCVCIKINFFDLIEFFVIIFSQNWIRVYVILLMRMDILCLSVNKKESIELYV
jgi:hypothetical protein